MTFNCKLCDKKTDGFFAELMSHTWASMANVCSDCAVEALRQGLIDSTGYRKVVKILVDNYLAGSDMGTLFGDSDEK